MKFIAIDIETTGLYPHPHSKIFCVAVNDGSTIKIVENPAFLKKVLEDKSVCKVIHNAAFDCFWLKRLHNIDVQNIWDTRLVEQIIIGQNLPHSNRDEALRRELSSSLLYTLSRYGLAELNKHMGASFANKNPNSKLTAAEIVYAKNDVKYLLHLQAMQEMRLRKLDLMRVATLENRLVEEVVKMRDRGIGFNKQIWKDIAVSNHNEYMRLMKALPATVSNWNSPQQIKKYFNSIGIPVQSLTGIKEFLPLYPNKVLSDFIAMRSLYKATTTYGMGWLEDKVKGNTIDEDGRIRADFEQILNTGRFACSNPNLQQLPRDGMHRSAFVPKKGHVFVIGDFDMQELGIMAAAAKEKIWIDAMLRREDIHSLTASLIYTAEWQFTAAASCTFPKKCICPEHQKMRHNAKTINFAIAYGAGPGKIGHSLGLKEKEAIRLLNKYKRVVPKLTRWLSNNARYSELERISYSADPFKRRRTLRDPESWMLRNIGKNNPVQAAGANMIKVAMVSLSDMPMVLVVHDEIILEVLKKDAKAAAKKLKGIMESAADYCTEIPGLIRVEPRIANNLLKQ